ncbi:MAG: alpha-amylase, partial [Sphingomonadaceae bacterium]|nr:alpha-amylase [Sphingomonadaceae bacterium]
MSLFVSLALAAASPAAMPAAQALRARLPEDETIYFLLPDRFENGDPKNDKGGLKGDRLKTGYDPTHKGFFHGGDLKGLTARLDYIQKLGATAIWLAPIFKNKPVQGAPGQETAAYHGYWVTDFTTVDPHFGTEADFKALVDAAHARGMKVYMDILINHTADVIQYRECPASSCAYRSRADYPYSRRQRDGAAINTGFAGDAVQTSENFAKLTDTDYAYQVFVPPAEAKVKVPAWLNDPKFYHNRGDSTFTGESSTMGDFSGLDDVMTEDPRVIDGFIDIYASWIDRFGIDGYRIDTAKHVNSEFWTKFTPAILERAKARGIPNFHIFGEVALGELDVQTLARFTREAGLPAVLDFAFRRAAIDAVSGKTGTDRLNYLFEGDSLYEGGAAAALRLPTFLGNHDLGRFAREMRLANPHADDAEILQRVRLGHALMFVSRQDAREDMFPSKVAIYNDNDLVGTDATTAVSNFDETHPLYREIAALAALRTAHAALRRGRQIIRNYSDKPGLFALSRVDAQSGEEVLAVFNTSTQPLTAHVEVDPRHTNFTALRGTCPVAPKAPGQLAISLAP